MYNVITMLSVWCEDNKLEESVGWRGRDKRDAIINALELLTHTQTLS